MPDYRNRPAPDAPRAIVIRLALLAAPGFVALFVGSILVLSA